MAGPGAIIAIMASLTVRNLDASIKTRLKIRAAKNGRSMEEEVRVLIEEAVEPKAATGAGLFQKIHKLVQRHGPLDIRIPVRKSTHRQPPDFAKWPNS
jgi:hypothetical protein